VGIMHRVKQGSRWTGGNFETFKVELVYENYAGAWVTYSNERTGKIYDCLIDAFVARFTETKNER
jgi:hypothetical protein